MDSDEKTTDTLIFVLAIHIQILFLVIIPPRTVSTRVDMGHDEDTVIDHKSPLVSAEVTINERRRSCLHILTRTGDKSIVTQRPPLPLRHAIYS